jgi:hypothetical protein
MQLNCRDHITYKDESGERIVSRIVCARVYAYMNMCYTFHALYIAAMSFT